MLRANIFNGYCAAKFHRKLTLPRIQAYSSSSQSLEEAELDTARQWYKTFNQSTIPAKISTTTFSRSSGPGGQKTNKTSSKATTVWPLFALSRHIPLVLQQELRKSRFYVSSSDSISIQCDAYRSQSDNEEETRRRLNDELAKLYKARVPGVTSPEQKKKVEQMQKAENAARLKMKKIQSDKKRARKGGGQDF